MQKKLQMILATAIFSVFAFSANVPAQTTWTAFWTKFKTAVAKNDKAAVSSLSKNKLSAQEYEEMFGTNARRKCFANAKPVKDEQGGYSVFCGEQGYYFGKVGGQFKFTEGFAND